MLLILDIFVIIFIAVLTFRTARDYGRNVVLWTVAAMGVGFGIQFFVPLIVLLFALLTGSIQLNSRSEDPSWLYYTIVLSFFGGIIGSFLVLRQASRLPNVEDFNPPSPPTTFDL